MPGLRLGLRLPDTVPLWHMGRAGHPPGSVLEWRSLNTKWVGAQHRSARVAWSRGSKGRGEGTVNSLMRNRPKKAKADVEGGWPRRLLMSGRSRKDCPGAVRRSVGRCGETWRVKHHTYTSSFSSSQRRVGSWAAAWRNSLSYRRQCEAGYCENSMASMVWYLASSRASWGCAARRVHRYRSTPQSRT